MTVLQKTSQYAFYWIFGGPQDTTNFIANSVNLRRGVSDDVAACVEAEGKFCKMLLKQDVFSVSSS